MKHLLLLLLCVVFFLGCGNGRPKCYPVQGVVTVDGKIEGASVGGQSVDVRATAIVWCCGKAGVIDPYPYANGSGGKGATTASGGKTDNVYSWTPAQTRDVK